GGTISSTGLYVAGSTAGNFTVTATSVADATKSAKASVAITAPAPPPGTATSITKDGITWTFSEAVYRQPWVDTNAFLFDAPADYMPSYGQHIAFADSYAGLLLMLNFPAEQKVNLTNYLVQYGIDLYGCVQAGYGWPAFG